MSNLLSILSIVLSLTLLIVTILFMVFNMPFIYGNGSSGMMIITVIVFAIITIISIIATIKIDEDEFAPRLVIIISCLSLLVVPIRGVIVSKEMRDPFKNIDVELVSYYDGFNSVSVKDGLFVEIKYTNNTKVDLELSGKLHLYEGDRFVAEFDIINERLLETNKDNLQKYHIPYESLNDVDYAKLTIKYTFESIRVDDHIYHYDPKEVILYEN